MSGYGSWAPLHRAGKNFNKAKRKAAKAKRRAILLPTPDEPKGSGMTFAVGLFIGLAIGGLAGMIFAGLVK